MKRWGDLQSEILQDSNLDAAFEEVVGHMEEPARHYKLVEVRGTDGSIKKTYVPLPKPTTSRKERVRAKREELLASVKRRIASGTFRIETFKEFWVHEGDKWRLIQSPTIEDRIGINAIIRVLEKHIYPTIVLTSGASIKGRGMHRLYRKMRSDIRHDREGTRYFYKCDIRKFYQSVVQAIMKMVIRRYVKDKWLLPILDSFVELLEKGISIGLRSSQFYGNILLSRLDHRMKEQEHCRYYYRYCDDIVILASNKKQLWHWRNVVHEEIAKLGLELKPSEAVRPTETGIDFLGYVDDGEHTRLRKRTKQNAARKLHKVKSRRRRQEIVGSLKGMAKWGDCGHLYKTLTGKSMKSFKELGLRYVAEDGKKRFSGKQVTLRSLTNIHITVEDFEKDVETHNGLRTVVSFSYDNGEKGKYFTADKEQLWYLTEAEKIGALPFDTTIIAEVFGDGKVRYKFS
jgi:hypothetical protein